jgi:hypothetical protein
MVRGEVGFESLLPISLIVRVICSLLVLRLRSVKNCTIAIRDCHVALLLAMTLFLENKLYKRYAYVKVLWSGHFESHLTLMA